MDYQEWFKLMQDYTKKPQDIQEQLKSLKQVEQWLEINLNMVKNSISFLSMYENFSNNKEMKDFFNNVQNYSDLFKQSMENSDIKSNKNNTPVDFDMNKFNQQWLANVNAIFNLNNKDKSTQKTSNNENK